MPRCFLSGLVNGVHSPGGLEDQGLQSQPGSRSPTGSLTNERNGMDVLENPEVGHFPGWFRTLAHELSTVITLPRFS